MKTTELDVKQYLYQLIEDKIFSAEYGHKKSVRQGISELSLSPDEYNMAIYYKLRDLDLSEVMDIFDGQATEDSVFAGNSKISLIFLLMKLMQCEDIYDSRVEIQAILNKHFKFDIDEEFKFQIECYIADTYGSRGLDERADRIYECEAYETRDGRRMADTRHLTNCASF